MGSCYIVAPDATEAWTGKEECVAAWTTGGWRFVAPADGMALLERATGTFAVYCNGAWETGIVRAEAVLIQGQQVIGPRAAAIDSPAGGTVVDGEARAALDAILGALRQHGLIES